MFLYKFYDERDTLLYVGITDNPAQRFKGHAATKSWWGDVVRREMAEMPVKEARIAERLVIQDWQPAYNVRRPMAQPIAEDDTFARQVGTRIKNQLVSTGRTQGDLALSLAVDRTTICRYLAGDLPMSLAQLGRIAEALDCDPRIFFELTQQAVSPCP